jgi:hypothetical protein
MNLIIGLFVGILAQALVVLGGFFAYRDKMFFVSQMKGCGIDHGLPFVVHGGMWGDLLIISPLIAVIVCGYGNQWTLSQPCVAIAIGFVVSAGMHYFLYTKGAHPSAHQRGGQLTSCGWIHLVYMGGALAVLILFFFCTPNISNTFLYLTSTLLAVHMFIGSQVVLGFINPSWFDEMPQKYFSVWITNGVIWALLMWRCYVNN